MQMQMWASKFHLVAEGCLELQFVIDPVWVGNQLM